MTFYEFYVRIDLAEHLIQTTNLVGAGNWLRWLGEQPTVARVTGECAGCGAWPDPTDNFCRVCGHELNVEEVPPRRSVGIYEEVAVLGSPLGEALRQAKGKIHHYKDGVTREVTGAEAAAKLRSASRYGAQVFET